METSFYFFTQIGFIVVTLFYYALLLGTLRSGLKLTEFSDGRKTKIFFGTIIALVTWAIFISILSIGGILSDFSSFPPRIGIVLVLPFVVMVAVTFSKTTGKILSHIPVQNIVRIHAFRLFVEILLWTLLVQTLLPVQMSFEGRNFDILAGLTAPLIAYLYSKNKISRNVVITWNVLGLILLFNIVAIAVLSMPTPIRMFMNEPANTIVTVFPIVWLPGLLVPLAYGLHFLSLRQMTMKENAIEIEIRR